MRYSIRITDPAAVAPMSLADAKAHLRVSGSDEDDQIAAYLAAAVAAVEGFTGQVLADSEFEIAWSGFPSYPELLALPREPVTEIVSLVYQDADDIEVSLAEADWRWSDADSSIVKPAFRTAWPTSSGEPGSVRLRFRAGYGDGLVPDDLLEAVRLTLGHFYRNREEVVVGSTGNQLPCGAAALCGRYRRLLF